MQQPMTVQDYLRVMRRRLGYIVAVFALMATATVAIGLSLPPVYRSTGKIAVESQQIPTDLVQSTVTGTAEARIGLIQQRVMTDAKLEGIITEFDLYPEDRARRAISDVVEKLRKSIIVKGDQDPFSPARATIAFSISFEHENPKTARDVAQRLVQLFLDENTKQRNDRAVETTLFLRQEAEKLGERARLMDRQVAEYKREHSNALPEHLGLRVNMLEAAQADLRATQREIAASEQEKRFLEGQRHALSAATPSDLGKVPDAMSPQQRLRLLKAELDRHLGKYTESHPDVVALKRAIARLEPQVGAGASRGGAAMSDTILDPGQAEIISRISAADAKVTLLRGQEDELRSRIAELQAQILETPKVELGMREMTFDYESALKEYEEVRSKQHIAELSANLESQKMAERFTLLEPPLTPVRPVRPDKLKLLGMGFVLALGGGLGSAFAVEALDSRIRDPGMLELLPNGGPMAILPYIERPGESRRQNRWRVLGWLALAVVLSALVVLAIVFLAPLTVFFDQL